MALRWRQSSPADAWMPRQSLLVSLSAPTLQRQLSLEGKVAILNVVDVRQKKMKRKRNAVFHIPYARDSSNSPAKHAVDRIPQ